MIRALLLWLFGTSEKNRPAHMAPRGYSRPTGLMSVSEAEERFTTMMAGHQQGFARMQNLMAQAGLRTY
jgi:hypothetical protein